MREARLEGLPLFENLTPGERAEIEALLEPASFRAGETILVESEAEEYLYILVSGSVEVHKEVSRGRRQRLAVIEAPAVVGEMGLMNEPRAAASVLTTGPVEAWRLSYEAFLEKLEAGSGAAYKVAYEIGRALAERMARTDESVAEIVARLEDAGSGRDLDVFREKLMREWSF